LPDWLTALLAEAKPKTAPTVPTPVNGTGTNNAEGLEFGQQINGVFVREASANIPTGSRNDTLTRKAGSYRAAGDAEEVILAKIRVDNALCSPPLSDSELQQIAHSVSRYPVGEHFPSRTDEGNARLFAAMNEGQVYFDHTRKRWLVWQGHHWAEDDTQEVKRRAVLAAEYRLANSQNFAQEAERKAESKWAFDSQSAFRVDSCLKQAQAQSAWAKIQPWDKSPTLLGVRNGVVDLTTGQVRDGKPEDWLTQHTDVVFDAGADCPRWRAFIGEIFERRPEMPGFIAQAVGYSLTGLTTEQCLFFCYGEGANGKSTFLDTLRAVLGPYGHQLPFASLELFNSKTGGNAGHQESLAGLDGKRLVSVVETGVEKRLNEALVKSLVGSDILRVSFKFGHEFDLEIVGKFWLAFNHKPRVNDDSFGFWRRIRLIPFNRQADGCRCCSWSR